MLLVCSACASNDDDGGGGTTDASVGFPDAPRPSDARPDSSTSTLPDAPGFNLGDGGFDFGDGGFDFGDGGFGACTSNAECTAVDDCCLVLGTFGVCVTGTESGTDCIPAF